MVEDKEKLLVMLRELGEIKGRTRFQKIIFLLTKREGIGFGYDFIPYYYGPYSHGLQLEIDLLETAGLIQVGHAYDVLYVHSLTERGGEVAQEIEQEIGQNDLSEFREALSRYRRRSTKSLIEEAKELAGMPV